MSKKHKIIILIALPVVIAAYILIQLIQGGPDPADSSATPDPSGNTAPDPATSESAGYAIKVYDQEIDPETYYAYIIQQTLLAQSKVNEPDADWLSQEIEGVPAADWIKEKAQEQIIYDHVIKAELEVQDIEADQSELDRLDVYLSQRWEASQAVFETNDCNKEQFDTVYSSFLYEDLVFEKYSADNPAEEEPSKVADRIVSAKYFLINKYSAEGKIYTGSEIDDLKKLAGDYVSQIENGTSIDETYKSYLIQYGDELQDFHPLPVSVISSDNEEYTSKIPNFVEELMSATIGKPFYAEDTYYIAVGIRQDLTGNTAVEQAYADNEAKKSMRVEFDKHIDEVIKTVTVEVNETIVEQYPPSKVEMPEAA